MENVTGIIEEIITRTPKPGMTCYDLVVDGRKFGNGFALPKGFAKGDRVQFVAEQKGSFWNVKLGTLKKWEGKGHPDDGPQNAPQRTTSAPAAPPARVAAPPTQSVPQSGRDDYWKAKELRDIEREKRYEAREEEKQARITFESSRKQAMDYVALMAQCDALFMKKMDKPADRHEYIRALVEDTHRRFYNEALRRADYLGNKPLVDEDLSVELNPSPGDDDWKDN